VSADVSRPSYEPAHVWREPPALAHLLGLCPLLAVTTSVARAIGLAIATGIVLIATSLVVSLVRHLLARELRLMSYVLVIGALVSAVDLAMRAWFSALHTQLGVFVPLIATNCVILARAEICAARAGAGTAIRDALAHAAAIAAAFLCFGALRELVGGGTLLAGVDMLRGGDGSYAGIVLYDGGFLLATLTPGAFLALALLSALHRRLCVARDAPAATGTAAAARG
jgi:electron transport complex protein RnfE